MWLRALICWLLLAGVLPFGESPPPAPQERRTESAAPGIAVARVGDSELTGTGSARRDSVGPVGTPEAGSTLRKPVQPTPASASMPSGPTHALRASRVEPPSPGLRRRGRAPPQPSRSEVRHLLPATDPVEVRAVIAETLGTEPGKVLTVAFWVTNNRDWEHRLSEFVSLPPAWRHVVAPDTFAVPPLESRAQIEALFVPRATLAGRYEVTYSVRDPATNTIYRAEPVTVTVQAVKEFALLLDESCDAVLSGEEHQASVRVLNRGNAPTTLEIRSTSNRGYPTQAEPAEVTLSPGESRVVLVATKTPSGETQPSRQISTVTVWEKGIAEDVPSASLQVAVDIIPRAGAKPDRYERIPVTLALRAGGEEDGLGVQGEVSGSGALDARGTRTVEFLFRTPYTRRRGLFVQQEAYRFSYSSPRLDLRLGDQIYGLSYLTARGYGRGLQLAVRPPAPVELGGYYLEKPWERHNPKRTGAYVSSRVSDRVELKLNLVYRTQPTAGGQVGERDRLLSLVGMFQPLSETKLELEYARSDSGRSPTVSDHAYSIKLNGCARDRVSYSFLKIHAGPDYHGYHRDGDYTNASANLRIGTLANARASYYRWRRNLDLRPSQLTASKEEMFQAGLDWRPLSKWYVSVTGQHFRNRDLLEPARHDYAEQALRLALGRSLRRLALNFDFRAGRREDFIAHETGYVQSYLLRASYGPTHRGSLVLYGGWSSDGWAATRLLGSASHLGVQASWTPISNLRLNLDYARYGDPGTHRVDLRAKYSLPDRTYVDLRVRHRRNELGGLGETSFILSCGFELGVPIRRKTTVGLVEGRVFDVQQPGSPGIPGVIVYANGSAAVSNENGDFDLGGFPPGSYLVHVDTRSVGYDRVISLEMPLRVEVVGGKTTRLDMGVINRASLSGVVSVTPRDTTAAQVVSNGIGVSVAGAPGGADAQPEPGGLGGILVELVDGGEILRRVTDSKGQFVFESLRPGKWRLKVYKHNVPSYYYVKQPEMEFDLAPGESKEVCVEVLPRLRRIKMIDRGEIR